MFIYCDIILVSLSHNYVYKSDMITIIAVALTWYNQGIVWQEWPVWSTGGEHR